MTNSSRPHSSLSFFLQAHFAVAECAEVLLLTIVRLHRLTPSPVMLYTLSHFKDVSLLC